MAESNRGTALTVFAVLFGILAISNFLKPLQFDEQTGFVLFGRRLSGFANTIFGPLFGLYLALYAAGIWRMRRYALTMAWIYVAYVVVNLILFNFYGPKPEGAGVGYAIFGLVYATVAVGVSLWSALTLRQRQAELT
jgi:hypothetical protein